MQFTSDSYCALKEFADIIGFRTGRFEYHLPEELLAVRRVINSPEDITLRIKDKIPASVWGISIHEDAPLLEDYVKFLLDSGVFYASMLEKKNHRTPLHILKLDLGYYEIPIIDMNIQLALSNLETDWEWARKELGSDFRYASLRAALFDEIRHLIAIELHFPERMHALNIHSVDALMEIEDKLSSPDSLFFHLTLDQPEIMSQIKRFRSIVFER